jgi:FlaA1/EpsC-like NDP-sugar epimerase
MTVPEAVQLVIQAAAIGRDGEALVLDMGEPVRILDVAHQLISMSGKDIEITFTGLRPGEKLHEDLLAVGEAAERPVHPLVQHVPVSPLQIDTLTSSVWPYRRQFEGQPGQRRMETPSPSVTTDQ